MHYVRLVCFLLGAWFSGGAFMAWVATQNFRGADRLLDQPGPHARLAFQALDALGPGSARLLLRYQVSEQNRFYFKSWELVQMGIGALLFLTLLFAPREDNLTLIGVMLMLASVAGQHFLLTPDITALGRIMDFVLPADPAPERSQFWTLHNTYSAVEVAKWGIALFISGRLIVGHRRRKSRRDAGEKLDGIDKSDHGHIDR